MDRDDSGLVGGDRGAASIPMAAATRGGAVIVDRESTRGRLQPQDLGFGPLFWTIREALVVADAATGEIVLWNPAAESLFGYSREEAVGMLVENLVPESLRSQHRAGLHRYAALGHGPLVDAVEPVSLPALRKDGTEIIVEFSLVPVPSPPSRNGTRRYVRANIRDVTNRRRAAEAHAWQAAILEATPDAIVVVAEDGAIAAVNAQAEQLLGYARAELLGQSVEILVPTRLRNAHVHLREAFAADPRVRPLRAGLDLVARHKDGREIPVEIGLSPLSIRDSRFVISAIRDVSERRQLEQERDQLAVIIESTHDGIVGVDRRGIITIWNSGAEQLYGYTAAEAIGQPIAMLVPAELTTERQSIIDQVVRGERVAPFEAERLTKDGRRIQVSLSVSPILGRDGTIIGAASNARDITERRRAEADRARLAAIVESTDEAIIAIDLTGRISAWNPGAEQLYGYSAAEAIGKPSAMLVLPELAAERQAKLARLMRGERIAPYETERLAKDGRRVRVILASSPVRGIDGTIIGAASIAHDVTALRTAEARLHEIETQYRILVDRMPAATYIEELDVGEPTWTTRFVSPQIEAMLGYPVDVWLNDPQFFATVLHPDDRDQVLAEDARTDATGEPYRAVYRVIAHDGRVVWVHDEAVLVHDETGQPQYWLGFMLDITEQKQMESERAAVIAAERETARRLEELDAIRADFTRMVAHELGSPIAAIRRSTELLAADSLTPHQQWALDVIQKEVGALRALVDDVVAIATIERDDFRVDLQRVPVERLLTGAYTYGRAMPGACPLTVTGCVAEDVWADPERIAQVLRNLLNNSALYSPPGTPITLSATRCDGSARIEVSDQGPGISEDDLKRIFEKFARGRNAAAGDVPGGGLGLYLSRRIILAHGSDLTVVSSPGQGATFGFELEIAP
jgi:PAS domain S-box-containing protein